MRPSIIKKLAALALAVLTIPVLSSCGGSQGSSSDKLYVAVAVPLTGTCMQDGEAVKDGVALAVKHINDQGGINGKQVELVSEDDRSDPKEAANIANKLANDKRILAVIGHYNSSCTLSGAPIYNRAGLVEITPGSTAPAISQAGPYTFRMIVTDAFQGDVLSKWMVQEEGLKRIAIIYENDDYGAGLKDVVSSKVKEYGGEIVGVESYYLGETKDFSPYITNLKAKNPDALVIAGLYNEGALIAKQAQNAGWKPPIFAVDGMYSSEYIKLGGRATEGTRMVGFFLPTVKDDLVQRFVADFQKQYGHTPGTYAAYGYDAMLAVAEAMKKGGTDREAIKNYLTNLKDFRGVTGVTSFDANGDCIKTPLKLIVKDGEFQLYNK